MTTHLVLLVHGIGEQTPGETVDNFVGATRQQLDLSGPVTHNSVLLANEPPQDAKLLQLYPCHIRRLQQTSATELVFAEIHWADLSPAPKGFLATSVALLHVVLGLGYLALDNVQNNAVPKTAYVQKLTPLFVWIFYAVIAPLNAFLFLGAISLLADPLIFRFTAYERSPAILLILLGLVVGLAGGYLARHARTYMARSFFRGLFVMGVITTCIGLIMPFGISVECAPPNMVASVTPGLAGIDGFVGCGVFLLNLGWLTAIVLLFLMVFVSVPGMKWDLDNKRSIYLAICAAMVLFWGIFAVALWAAFEQAVIALVGSHPDVPLMMMFNNYFPAATRTLVYAVLAIAVLTFAGAIVGILRNRIKDDLAHDPKNPTRHDLWFGRLILNPILNLGLFGAILVQSFGVFYATFEYSGGGISGGGLDCASQTWMLARAACNIDAFISGSAGSLALGASTLLGFVLVNYSNAIANFLGVALDIVVYATRSGAANPRVAGQPNHYVHAERIEGRFRSTLKKLLIQEHADKITVISHSQGTVVVTRGLQQMRSQLPVKPTLVTMGSPLTHVYTHYFALNYQMPGECPDWLESWHNIYRRDDFVGTYITGHGAQNHPVRAAGHTGYWIDPEVWKIFRSQGLFPPLPGTT
ncbi:MAG: hypothetical protein ACK5M4_10895 [Pseudorhodobacter sp.]